MLPASFHCRAQVHSIKSAYDEWSSAEVSVVISMRKAYKLETAHAALLMQVSEEVGVALVVHIERGLAGLKLGATLRARVETAAHAIAARKKVTFVSLASIVVKKLFSTVAMYIGRLLLFVRWYLSTTC